MRAQVLGRISSLALATGDGLRQYSIVRTKRHRARLRRLPLVTPARMTALAFVLPVALPASANAATLTLDKPCYREGSDAVAVGAGFAPNSPVRFSLNGSPFTDPVNPPIADATGGVSAGFSIGSPPGRQAQYLLAATDGTNTAETEFIATDLDVIVTPKRGDPGRRKRIRARGFDPGSLVRFHVRGPRRRTGTVGTARGPCGTLNKKTRIFRSTDPTGTYTVQFDQRASYSRSASPRVVFQVSIIQTSPPRRRQRRHAPAPRPRPGPPSNCQGYSPCITPGPDVDCAGGSGDGPRYRDGPIYVTGSDPYDLDRDGDGVACED